MLQRLRAELLLVREQGWAFVDEELEEGLRAIAAPINDLSGRVIAAVNVSSPVSRGSADLVRERVPAAPACRGTRHRRGSGPQRDGRARRPRAWGHDRAGRRAGDIDMYYELHGSGEPLVIIGGLASDISQWGWLTDWCAQTSQVLAFDNRGAGRTDKPDAPYTIPMMADDTDALMEAVGMSHATVLGISMGGKIALDLALEHPDRVARLILVSTSASARPETPTSRMEMLSMLSSLVFRGKYPQPRYAFARQRQASRAYECTDRLDEIHVPTTILHGRKDRIVPFARRGDDASWHQRIASGDLRRRAPLLPRARAQVVPRHRGERAGRSLVTARVLRGPQRGRQRLCRVFASPSRMSCSLGLGPSLRPACGLRLPARNGSGHSAPGPE